MGPGTLHTSAQAQAASPPRPQCPCLRPEGSRIAAWHDLPGVRLRGMPHHSPCSSSRCLSQCCVYISALLVQGPGEVTANLKKLACIKIAPEYICNNVKCKGTRGTSREEYLIEFNLGMMDPFYSVAQGLTVSSVFDLKTWCLWSLSACRCTCCRGLEAPACQQLTCRTHV